MIRFTRLLLCLVVACGVMRAEASVLTPGENPWQYDLAMYIRNDNELPYPPSGHRLPTLRESLAGSANSGVARLARM